MARATARVSSPAYAVLAGAGDDDLSAPMFLCVPLPDAPLVTIGGAEGRHAATVARLRVGERIDLTDGAGTVAQCTVASVAGPDEVVCAVASREVRPAAAPRLVVVQALPKGERGELAVEVLTEVGVDEIVPWAASRCVTRWDGERGRRSRAKWVTAAGRAARQSRRDRWPVVAELATSADVVRRAGQARLAVVLWEDATEPLTTVLAGAGLSAGRLSAGGLSAGGPSAGGLSGGGPAGTGLSGGTLSAGDAAGPAVSGGSATDPGTDPPSGTAPAGSARSPGADEIVLIVGPEGSITDAELAAFVDAGARPAVLGPTVLRTSTAGLVAATVVMASSSRWHPEPDAMAPSRSPSRLSARSAAVPLH
jgi:16S rRNA (uracil1498-N3)-methyltransferase